MGHHPRGQALQTGKVSTHCQDRVTGTFLIRFQTRVAQSEQVLLTESPWMHSHSFTQMKFTQAKFTSPTPTLLYFVGRVNT